MINCVLRHIIKILEIIKINTSFFSLGWCCFYCSDFSVYYSSNCDIMIASNIVLVANNLLVLQITSKLFKKRKK